MCNFKELDFEKLKEDLGERLAFQLLNNFYLTYEYFDNYLNLDNKNLPTYVHKLKGTAGNLKINKIFDFCVEIENKPKNEEEVNKLKLLLKDVLNEISENRNFFELTNDSLELSQLKKEIEKLLIDIEEYNYIDDEKIDVIINSFKEHTNTDEKLLNEFKLLFAQGDYTKLKEIILELQELI